LNKREKTMTHKFTWTSIGLLALVIGCASVEVKAPKEPIKMDIAMRLDVYQHVVKDVDSIESIVEAGSPKAATRVSSIRGFWVGTAYADDGLGQEAFDAAYRRRDRRSELTSLETKGALGEGSNALVTLRDSGNAQAKGVMTAENNDRMIIYRAIAAKNGSSVEEVQKVYAGRIREGLPSGAYFQNAEGSWGQK
jgi:uncharacterized protein YdbL (DUF1318 family)